MLSPKKKCFFFFCFFLLIFMVNKRINDENLLREQERKSLSFSFFYLFHKQLKISFHFPRWVFKEERKFLFIIYIIHTCNLKIAWGRIWKSFTHIIFWFHWGGFLVKKKIIKYKICWMNLWARFPVVLLISFERKFIFFHWRKIKFIFLLDRFFFQVANFSARIFMLFASVDRVWNLTFWKFKWIFSHL